MSADEARRPTAAPTHARALRPSKTRLQAASRTTCRSSARRSSSCPKTGSQACRSPRRCATRCANSSARARHEGRRRQMQYIGKLMRQADVEPMREAVAAMQLGRAQGPLALHQAERWRAELLAERRRADALGRRAPGQPTCSSCAAWCARARKDAALAPEQRSGRAYRELFQFIKEHSADERDVRSTPGDFEPRPHRARLDQRPRVERRLRGQGHPGAAGLARARACATRSPGRRA